MIEIRKNFLEKNVLDNINKTITSFDFPWYYSGITNREDKNKQFFHSFYFNSNINSNYFDLIRPILHELKPVCLFRIKLNLLPKTDKIIEHEYHTDVDNDKIITSILYLNTNNGYTKFKDKKIKSEENKLVTFPSNLKHHGTTCTNANERLVLNIMYVK